MNKGPLFIDNERVEINENNKDNNKNSGTVFNRFQQNLCNKNDFQVCRGHQKMKKNHLPLI